MSITKRHFSVALIFMLLVANGCYLFWCEYLPYRQQLRHLRVAIREIDVSLKNKSKQRRSHNLLANSNSIRFPQLNKFKKRLYAAIFTNQLTLQELHFTNTEQGRQLHVVLGGNTTRFTNFMDQILKAKVTIERFSTDHQRLELTFLVNEMLLGLSSSNTTLGTIFTNFCTARNPYIIQDDDLMSTASVKTLQFFGVFTTTRQSYAIISFGGERKFLVKSDQIIGREHAVVHDIQAHHLALRVQHQVLSISKA